MLLYVPGGITQERCTTYDGILTVVTRLFHVYCNVHRAPCKQAVRVHALILT